MLIVRRFKPLLASLLLTLVTAGGCKGDLSVTFAPQAWDFGSLQYGSQATKSVTVTNTSGIVLEIATDGWADPEVSVSGLPVANLAPNASATLQLTVRPNFNQTVAFNGVVNLLLGGHSGEWGDVSNSVTFPIQGQIVSTLPTVCTPGPDGDVSAFGELQSDALVQWAQSSYACGTLTGTGAAGASCQQPSDCVPTCCACPEDCAGFSTQGCVFGSCAQAPVACDLTRMLSRAPVLCPDGGHPPSAILGVLGFDAGTSAAVLTLANGTEALSVFVGRGGGPSCEELDGGAGLRLFLSSSGSASTPLGPGLYPIATLGGTRASLTDPGNGSVVPAASGYILLAGRTDAGTNGSFDLQFSGNSSPGEVWGSFNAPLCP